MKQYVVPYLMSSHPGCTMQEAVRLAEYLRDINHEPEQVQDFYPTPSTLSTVMYDTGLDPRTMEPVYIPKIRTKRPCSARSCSIAGRRTTSSCARRCRRRGGPT